MTAVPGRRLRVGIDVGGTFTHAVAFDPATATVVATCRVPTTHRATEGVARGVGEALAGLFGPELLPSEVTLVAHSTTQATNALLEGDTARVGILGLVGGPWPTRAAAQLEVPWIPLAPGKSLETCVAHLKVIDDKLPSELVLTRALRALAAAGAEVTVVSQAFGVENPALEEAVVTLARQLGMLATSASSLSGLYGLRLRTRTACVNASITPRMVATAQHTARAVETVWADRSPPSPTGGEAVAPSPSTPPLMVMRSDGGIMSLDEMQLRPVLTMLSGPAAGVAAALRYSRVSDGLFLEIGGTSTDVSALKDGQVRQRPARIGGHRLSLRTVDVRTVGVAGGSLVRVVGSQPVDVGPRSAHIAGVEYAVFTPGIRSGEVEPFVLDSGEGGGYLCFRRKGREGMWAVTPSCAARLLGYIGDGDEAAGHLDSARAAFEVLAGFTGHDTADDLARTILELGAQHLDPILDELLAESRMDPLLTSLVGGGGGAGAWVPFLAQRRKMPHVVVDHATVISAIGCAVAMLRETQEHGAVDPSDAQLATWRREVVERLVLAGARREHISVEVEVDRQRHRVRVTASGSADAAVATEEAIPARREHRAVADLGPPARARLAATTAGLEVYQVTTSGRVPWGSGSHRELTRVVDLGARIRLQRAGATTTSLAAGDVPTRLPEILEQESVWGDHGPQLPETFLLFRERMVDLSGLVTTAQVVLLSAAELEGLPAAEPVVILTAPAA